MLTAKPITFPKTKTALYRHYGEGDVLLYVGISLNPIARNAAHMRQATWAEEIVRITIERFETRYLAEKAERAALRKEQPKYNTLRPTYDPPHDVTMADMEAAILTIGRK